MGPFEFIFGLFGLLLGLCIAEIFGGLGRAYEQRRETKLGLLTPLLAVLVLCDLISFWSILWEEQGDIPMNPVTLMVGAAFGGIYYLAAYIVFPRELKARTSHDDHFFAVRRLILGISIVAFFGIGLVQYWFTHKLDTNDFFITSAAFAPVYAVAFLSKRKLPVTVAIALLIGLNQVGAVTHALNGG